MPRQISPQTKPRACNVGLLFTSGEYLVIFDAEDTRTLIRDLLIQEHGAEGDQAGIIAQRISRWKNDRVLPEQALASATTPADMLCAQAYLRYKRALQAYNALDFDDLLLLPPLHLAEQGGAGAAAGAGEGACSINRPSDRPTQ